MVADVEMVAAGITAREVVCRVRDAVPGPGETRSAAAVREAFAQVGTGAVWVVGCAPTALFAAAGAARPSRARRGAAGRVRGGGRVEGGPARVGLPAVSNVSEKGGSAVAAAAVNALLYLKEDA